jgi:hypothetical protein
VELATPRPVKLSITVKSGPFLSVKLVAVLLNSQSNAARLNALPQLHVQPAKLSLVHTPLTSAATLSTALQMNIVTNANWLSAQMSTHQPAKYMKTARLEPLMPSAAATNPTANVTSTSATSSVKLAAQKDTKESTLIQRHVAKLSDVA